MQRVVSLVINYSTKCGWLVASPKSIPKTINTNTNTPKHIHLLNLRNNNNNNNNNNKGEEIMKIPKHVAAILDGNRRWLKQKGMELDYRPFFKAYLRFADCCLKWGVPTATGYLYGLGNLQNRTQEEIDLFMGQFEIFLEEELEYFMRKGVKLTIVGETSKLPESCRAKMEKVEEATKNNTKLEWTLAMCYTAQWDILEATKKIFNKLKQGTLEIEDVNEDLIENHLSLLCGGNNNNNNNNNNGSKRRRRPPLDLFIRMGGQFRIGGLSLILGNMSFLMS